VQTVADIVFAARRVAQFVDGMTRTVLEEDLLVQSAVLHQVLVMGEAVKRLSPEFRAAHAELPWAKMAGMRDVVIHLYDRVELDTVWAVATTEVHVLIAHLEPLLPPPPED
jgi:uncharacterized protein with HEPN domain